MLSGVQTRLITPTLATQLEVTGKTLRLAASACPRIFHRTPLLKVNQAAVTGQAWGASHALFAVLYQASCNKAAAGSGHSPEKGVASAAFSRGRGFPAMSVFLPCTSQGLRSWKHPTRFRRPQSVLTMCVVCPESARAAS